MTRHIVAMGGGGFLMNPRPEPTALDRYAVELTGASVPRVCFAPTAAADDPEWSERFRIALGSLGVRTSVLRVWHDAAASMDAFAEADLLYVGGGSTVNLLALWAAHGVDEVIRSRYATGALVLAGVSAGACCWHQACVTDSFGPLRPFVGGLGLVRGSFCPHFDGEPGREPTFRAAVASAELPDGVAADDGAAVHYIDDEPARFVTEREGARVFRVARDGEGTRCEPQPMTVLGEPAVSLTP